MNDKNLSQKTGALWVEYKHKLIDLLEQISEAPVPEECFELIEHSFRYGAGAAMEKQKMKDAPGGASINNHNYITTEIERNHGGNVMEAKVIRIELDNDDVSSSDDLIKMIAEAVSEAITPDLENRRLKKHIAKCAWEAWIRNKDSHFEEIAKEYGGEVPEGDDRDAMVYAAGFYDGYRCRMDEKSQPCD